MNRFTVNRALPVWALLLGLIMVAFDAVDDDAGKNRFAGETFPEPPFQHQPWTPPKLPKSPEFGALIETTRLLFDNGMSDPRGCEYRGIRIRVGSLDSESATEVETCGWVLPQVEAASGGSPQSASTRHQAVQKFAICWNGLVYPVVSVGQRRDLDRDIDAMFAKLTNRPKPTIWEWTVFYSTLDYPEEVNSVSPDAITAAKCPLLLRLGKAARARDLWDILAKPRDMGVSEAAVPPTAPKTGGPTVAPIPGLEPIPEGDAPKLPAAISRRADSSNARSDVCMLIIKAWLFSSSERALCAYLRRDDRLARLSALNLNAAMPPLRKHVESLFSQSLPPGMIQTFDSPVKFLDYFPALATELDRREKERPRVPATANESKKAKRIQDLIRGLEDIGPNSTGMVGSTGEVGFITQFSPFVRALIAEGDDAIEPLLDCLESDTRLTRTVIYNGRLSHMRTLQGVDTPAYLAISGILKTPLAPYAAGPDDLKGRAAAAAEIRKYWKANKGIAVDDRLFAILADDNAKPSDWVQAADNIVRASEGALDQNGNAAHFHGGPSIQEGGVTGTGKLRGKKDSSVSDLLKRRVEELAKKPVDPWGSNLSMAVSLANNLKEWDGKAEVAALHNLCMVLSKAAKDADSRDARRVAAVSLGRLAADLIELGDAGMMQDSAQWLREMTPKILTEEGDDWVCQDHLVRWFEPIWRNPGAAVMQDAASYLFKDERSPWPNYIKTWLARGDVRQLIVSPLLGLRGFREMVISELKERSPIGVCGYIQDEKTWGVAFDGASDGFMPMHARLNPTDPLARHPPDRAAFRVCDLYAWELGSLPPMPALEFYWPEKERDEAIFRCSEILRQFGERYRLPTLHPIAIHVDGSATAIISFPEMDHPATDRDVNAGEAIFLLPQSAGAKRWPMRQFPMTARLKATNGSDPGEENDGLVWQAEEGAVGARRQLYFGFCGKHRLLRVTDEQLEFPGGNPWEKIADGLECKFVFKSDATYPISKVDAPLVFILSFRNMDANHPLDLKTLFSPSMKVSLFSEKKTVIEPTRMSDVVGSEIQPRHSSELELPATRQILNPLTETQIMEVHLHDLFSITQAGSYYLKVTFGSSKQENKRKPIWTKLNLE